MTIRIVADSTCDLPAELIHKYNITLVPLYIDVGEKEFRDGIDMTREEFYRRRSTNTAAASRIVAVEELEKTLRFMQ